MPDPIQPPPSRDEEPEVSPADIMPKPRGKSGFNPAEYEAERSQELHIKPLVYREAVDTLKQRMAEESDALVLGERRFVFDNFTSRGKTDLPLASIGNDQIVIEDVWLPREAHQTENQTRLDDDNLVVINFTPYSGGELLFPASFVGQELQVRDFAIILSAESDPVIAVRRTTRSSQDMSFPDRKSWTEVISDPNNKLALTNEECKNILKILRETPLKLRNKSNQ